jgi:DNA-binding GntR family transcriptional regulator
MRPDLSLSIPGPLAPYLPAGLLLADGAEGPARVQGEFKRLLLVQRLHPGQKVPLDEIAANLGLSRTPVREAMRLLETEGLVRSSRNRGFLVRRLSTEDTSHLFEARLCLEAQAAVKAAKGADASFLRRLRAIEKTYAEALSGSPHGRRLGMLADKAFHLCIAAEAGNPFIVELLANIFDRLLFTRPLEGFPLVRMPQALAEHAAILGALQQRDARRVREAMVENIKRGGAAIVAYLRESEASGIALQ